MVPIDNLIELKENIPDADLKGKIKLQYVQPSEKSKLLRLKELYGNSIFNSDSDLQIYGPESIYLFGKDVVLEGDVPLQLEYVLFTEESGNIRYGIIGEQREGMTLTNSGLLTVIETGLDSTYTKLRVEYKKTSSSIPIFNDIDVEIRKRTYPENIILDGPEQITTELSEYTWHSETEGVNGKYDANWELFGDIENYASILESTANKCVIKRNDIPETIVIGQIKLTLRKQYNKELVAEEIKTINLANPDVIMTFDSNPEVLNVLYNAELCASDKYLLKSDAQKITSFVKNGESVFKNSNIKKFNEFKEFTGFRILSKGSFDECQMLSEITLPENLITIEESAFNNCTSLTEINIPRQVNSLDQGAFKNCAISKIIVDPDNIVY